MDVNLDRILIPVILCIVGISVHNSTSSTSFLVFFGINTIIFAILVGSRKPSLVEIDKASPLLSFFEVGGEAQGDFIENATDDKVDESNIKDESADNHGDEIEITTQEQEESDDNLKTRIESFIAKVYGGWIEESHWDKYGIDI
ncbi:hypothetical protein CR513_22050, partial [Mucuna pruriens]